MYMEYVYRFCLFLEITSCLSKFFKRNILSSMQGIIGIEKLLVKTVIGVFPEERGGEQELFIDLKVRTDVAFCCLSDDLSDALNYVALKELVERIAKENQFSLIETFAYASMAAISNAFAISWIWIRVGKPSAIENASSAFVELENFVKKGISEDAMDTCNGSGKRTRLCHLP